MLAQVELTSRQPIIPMRTLSFQSWPARSAIPLISPRPLLLSRCLERKPENPEDRACLVQSLEKAGKKSEADQERESAAEALAPTLCSLRMST